MTRTCAAVVILTVFLLHALSQAQSSEFFVPASGPTRFRVTVRGKHAENGNYTTALRRGFAIANNNWNLTTELQVTVRYKNINTPYSQRPVRFVQVNNEYIQAAAAASRPFSTRPVHGNSADIELELSDNTLWNLDDVEPPPTHHDLTTVVLQQLYRHYMFSGYLKSIKKAGTWVAHLQKRRSSRFDNLIVNKDGCKVLLYRTDDVLHRRLKKERPEVLAAALTNGELYFASADGVPLNAPSKFDEQTSIYALTPGQPWSLMQPGVPAGKRATKVPDVVLAMQRKYFSTLQAPDCAQLNSPYGNEPLPPPGLVKSKKRGKRRVGGMPVWAFGLSMVVLLIALTALLFGICTFGAVAKQKEKRTCWKRLTWCCTGVDIAPNKADKPVFVYVDNLTAQRVQTARTSTEAVRVVASASRDAARASRDIARASVDIARERLGAVRRASVDAARSVLGLPVVNTVDDDIPTADITDVPPPTAETQLPGRLQTQ